MIVTVSKFCNSEPDSSFDNVTSCCAKKRFLLYNEKKGQFMNSESVK